MIPTISRYLLIASLVGTSATLAQEPPRPESPTQREPTPQEPRPPLPPPEVRERPRSEDRPPLERPDRPDAPERRERAERERAERDRADRPDRPLSPERRAEPGRDAEPRQPRDRRPDRAPEQQRREAANLERKPTPYLGVVTVPAPPFLSAQLGMDQGFGLIVENVLHDSPAQAAGVQKFDVLKGLNDQQLVSPEQLSRLVHRLGKDAEATITLVRKGQEQKLSIKVGEKMMPAREEPRGFGFSGRPEIPELQEEMRRRMQEAGGPGGNEMMRRMQERMRDYQKRMREYQESMRGYQDRIREWQRNPGSEPPQMPRIPEFPGESGGQERREGPGQPGMRPADLLREMRPGGPPDVRAEWSDGSSRWNAARARVKMRDADGELEIALKDGKRILTIKGPEGEVVFTGPVDTPEERLAIPERYRGKLAAMAPPPPSDFAPEGERPHPRSPGLVVPPVQRAPDVQ